MLHAAAVDAVRPSWPRRWANAVFTNHDDEPQALQRDNAAHQLARNGVAMHTYKDHTVLERTKCSPNRHALQRVYTVQNAWLRKNQ